MDQCEPLPCLCYVPSLDFLPRSHEQKRRRIEKIEQLKITFIVKKSCKSYLCHGTSHPVDSWFPTVNENFLLLASGVLDAAIGARAGAGTLADADAAYQMELQQMRHFHYFYHKFSYCDQYICTSNIS